MIINFGNFTKRINSLKVPGDTLANSIDVKLKENSSVENPIFILSGAVSNFENYDYLEVPEWHKYYYITDVVITSKMQAEFHCEVDVLASYRSAILGTKAFIEYANVSRITALEDPRISFTNNVIATKTEVSPNVFSSISNGTYVLGTAGKTSSATVGMVNYYGLSRAALEDLGYYFYENGDFFETLEKWFNNPYESIVECHYIPYPITSLGNVTTVWLGDVQIKASSGAALYGYSIGTLYGSSASNGITFSHDVTIPSYYDDWRDRSNKCAFMELYLPYYGAISVDIAKLEQGTAIHVDGAIDMITGDLYYICSCNKWKKMVSTNIAVPIATGQTVTNAIQGATQVIGGVASTGAILAAGAATGGTGALVAAGVSGISSIASGVVEGFREETSSKGTTGSFSLIGATNVSGSTKIVLTLYVRETETSIDGLQDCNGLPYFNTGVLSDFSGYVKCQGASVSCNAHSSDKEKINSFLNNGIFIE